MEFWSIVDGYEITPQSFLNKMYIYSILDGEYIGVNFEDKFKSMKCNSDNLLKEIKFKPFKSLKKISDIVELDLNDLYPTGTFEIYKKEG